MADTKSTKKRKKVSGLTGLELTIAYEWLHKLKKSLISVDDDAATPQSDVSQLPATFDPVFEETLDTMISMMESKLKGPQV